MDIEQLFWGITEPWRVGYVRVWPSTTGEWRRRCAAPADVVCLTERRPSVALCLSVLSNSRLLHSQSHTTVRHVWQVLTRIDSRSYSSHAQSAAAAAAVVAFLYPWYAADDDKQHSISAESRIYHSKHGTRSSTGMQFWAEVKKSRGHGRLLFKRRLVTQEQILT